MCAEEVGWNTNRLVLGKLSGRNAFKTRMEELGISFNSQEDLNDAFQRFKVLADKKSEIYDDDLQALVSDARSSSELVEKYKLIDLNAGSRIGETPEATLTLEINGEQRIVSSSGDGPVDAIFKAIEKSANSQAKLALYNVSAITTGTDSQGKVSVRLEKNGQIVNGSGADTDIVIASAKAYIHALNLLEADLTKANPQTGGNV